MSRPWRILSIAKLRKFSLVHDILTEKLEYSLFNIKLITNDPFANQPHHSIMHKIGHVIRITNCLCQTVYPLRNTISGESLDQIHNYLTILESLSGHTWQKLSEKLWQLCFIRWYESGRNSLAAIWPINARTWSSVLSVCPITIELLNRQKLFKSIDYRL